MLVLCFSKIMISFIYLLYYISSQPSHLTSSCYLLEDFQEARSTKRRRFTVKIFLEFSPPLISIYRYFNLLMLSRLCFRKTPEGFVPRRLVLCNMAAREYIIYVNTLKWERLCGKTFWFIACLLKIRTRVGSIT